MNKNERAVFWHNYRLLRPRFRSMNSGERLILKAIGKIGLPFAPLLLLTQDKRWSA